MICEILSVGTELLMGQVANTTRSTCRAGFRNWA